jgi:hypothetical protein
MGFLTSLVDDAKKDVNPAHVIALILVVAVVAWGFIEVMHTHQMPSNLGGAAQLLGGAGAVNVAHKMQDIVASFQKPQQPGAGGPAV